ncbi:MAG: hypothetical protein KJ698_12340 [Actinobacteria bacterium]|nr:hypothetical protein [Actinomycetota bacterium]
MRPRVLVGLGMVVALVATATMAGAATTLGGSRVSSPSATDWEYAPAVAWNGTANQYLVVWQDNRNLGTRGYDIYGRRVGADGKPIGREFRISGPADTLSEGDPAVAWNASANEYLVVWWEYKVQGVYTYFYDTWGRRIAADGALLGKPFRISTPGSHTEAADVAYNTASTQYLVVWSDSRNWADSGDDIYGHRVRSDGMLLGTDFQISSDTRSEEAPAVAYAATTNKFIVVWALWNYRAILGQQVKASGALAGGQVQISSPSAEEALSPDVDCARSVNKCLVVWHGSASGSDDYDIFGQRVRSDLAHAVKDLNIRRPAAAHDAYGAAVAWDQTAGRFLVVWNDNRTFTSTGRDDIYGRRVPVTGAFTERDFLISPRNVVDYRGFPAVAANTTADEYLVVWEDWRDYTTRGTDLYDRRVAG